MSNTVNFFMSVEIPTGHPNFEEEARWIGRAEIMTQYDYDGESDEPFPVEVADVTDLFYLSHAWADIITARRVELPDNSKAGYTFRYRLQQAAITAYHNPTLQPAEMPG